MLLPLASFAIWPFKLAMRLIDTAPEALQKPLGPSHPERARPSAGGAHPGWT